MLQFRLVHIDWHLRTHKVLQPTRMIQVQVAQDDHLDVGYLVARLLDRLVELLVRRVIHPRKDVVDRRPPHFWIVLPASGLPQDQALLWVLDQDGHDHQLASLGGRRGWVGQRGGTTRAFEPPFLCFEIADVQQPEFGTLGRFVEQIERSRHGHCCGSGLVTFTMLRWNRRARWGRASRQKAQRERGGGGTETTYVDDYLSCCNESRGIQTPLQVERGRDRGNGRGASGSLGNARWALWHENGRRHALGPVGWFQRRGLNRPTTMMVYASM